MAALGSTTQIMEGAVRQILEAVDDPTREGLLSTPARYSRFLQEFLSPPEFTMTTFDAEQYDEVIVQSNIPFYSLCEHHLAPFFGEGFIAYIPNKKIVGLSKLARTLEKFSRRLQNQERITTQVAEYLTEHLDPQGVAVVLKAQHLCMSMRGVQKPGVITTTSKMTGAFMDHPAARNEFLQLI
jgi:GTP cyclohydrolase I